MKKVIVEWAKTIILALILGIVITSFISGTKVDGVSMVPTLNHNDFLITFNKGKNIKRGDIIIVDTDLEFSQEDLASLGFINRLKAGKTKKLIKRVIALEGDSLVIENGMVILNGKKLKENYINGNQTFGNLAIEKIPEGKIFVMGDNRSNSLDSRDKRVGLVDKEDVIGKVVFRLYPFSKFGKL